MFFVVRSNDSLNFPLGLIKYIVVVIVIEPCFGIGLSLSLTCQLTSEDIKQHYLPTSRIFTVQELCESRGGRPGLSVLTSLLVSADVKLYFYS